MSIDKVFPKPIKAQYINNGIWELTAPFEYRNKDSGVKYLMRGPSIDWGLIYLKPGEMMGGKAHGLFIFI